MKYIALNGQILPQEEAGISPLDRGFLFGDGLFETIRIRNGRAVFLDKHLARLRESARFLDISFPRDMDFSGIIRELLKKNKAYGDAALKICLSRGVHQGRISLYRSSKPTIVIFIREFHPVSVTDWEKGVALTVEHEIFQNSTSLTAKVKSLNYLFYLLIHTRAEKKGFNGAIVINEKQELCECATSNLFFFRNGCLETPDLSCGLLPGIMRTVLMECLAEAGIGIREVRLPFSALKECEEIFITNALLEIMPVRRVDRDRFLQREMTRLIWQRFQAWREAM